MRGQQALGCEIQGIIGCTRLPRADNRMLGGREDGHRAKPLAVGQSCHSSMAIAFSTSEESNKG